ncbi:unnamed protein product [Broad bean necrosis virus]|uniref:Triple-gene-block third protein n=1 Tax=Broad bean necrosis virus TaxID=79918 RepID=Q9YPH1_9VIRU|nr:unnamed protein product [Broad bean necrosis virus]BAA34698.1 unnamed protein product [Broad bean necrosis virus]
MDPPVIINSRDCSCQHCYLPQRCSHSSGSVSQDVQSPVEEIVQIVSNRESVFDSYYLLICCSVCFILGLSIMLFINNLYFRNVSSVGGSYYYQDLNSVEYKSSGPIDADVIERIHHFQQGPLGRFKDDATFAIKVKEDDFFEDAVDIRETSLFISDKVVSFVFIIILILLLKVCYG